MAIEGTKRESKDFDESKKVGLFIGKVITINPTPEEFQEILGIELKEDSKATEYLGTSKDNNTSLRISIWLEDMKTQKKIPVQFFIENKERENKDMTKKQYINSVGSCAWADDPNNLQDWFTKYDYRVAFNGEEELYSFMRTWLSELDYSNVATSLQLDWKKLMKGNVKELKEQIDGEWCIDSKTGLAKGVGAMATVVTKEKDGEIKEYQSIYNKAFFPPYSLKNFRLIDYSDQKVIDSLKAKKSKELKSHERFVLSVIGEYGCRDFYSLKDMKDYDPNENLVASEKVISDESSEY